METRRRNRRVQVQSSDVAVGTGVYAPSSVATNDKAANQAFALSNALGFGQQFAGQQIERKQNIDSAEGARAAMSGEFTDEELHTMEKSAAYVQGAQKVLAKQRIIEDAAAAHEWYQAEFDKGADLGQLRHGLNEFWKARYEGVSTGIAREIAPLMAQASDNIMVSHAKFQAEETQLRLQEAQGEVLYAALKSGDYDWNALRQEGNSVVGKDAMNAIAVQQVSQFAADSLDESVWDREEFKMLRTNPTYRDAITDNISAVRTARHKANENATLNEQGFVLATGGKMADDGSSDFPAWMEKATKADPVTGVALVETDTQSTALWARWMKARSAPSEDSANSTLWRMGNARAIPSNADRDKAAMQDAEARAQELANDGQIPEEQVPAAARAYLIERSVTNNWLPADLKRELELTPDNTAFPQAVEMFEQFEAQRPDWIAQHIDPDVTRNIRAYQRHLAQTGDPAQALERTNTSTPALYKDVPEKARYAAEDEIVENLMDGPLWFDSGVEDNNRLRGMVREDFRYYVEAGLPVEMAVQETVKNLKGRYKVVDGQFYRANEGWGPNAEKAAELAKTALAADLELTTLFGNPDIDDIAIIPVPKKPGHVYVAISGPLQSYGSMTEVPISKIEADYQTYLQAAAATAEDRADVDAERSAREAYMPIPASASFEDPVLYEQMLKERDAAWNALSPAQRDVLKARQRK